MNEANEFLLGGGGAPSAKFDRIGVVVRGKILSTEVTDQTEFGTNKVLTWDDGKPRKQLVITLQTDQRDDDMGDDDGKRRIYAKGNMLDAIREAAYDHRGLQVGGELAVKYVANGKPSQKGWNPPKQYKAQYTPPTVAVPEDFDAEPVYDDTPF